MTWIYILIIGLIFAIIIFIARNKGKNPNHDASLSKKDKEALDEDYLSHGSNDNEDDRKNI